MKYKSWLYFLIMIALINHMVIDYFNDSDYVLSFIQLMTTVNMEEMKLSLYLLIFNVSVSVFLIYNVVINIDGLFEMGHYILTRCTTRVYIHLLICKVTRSIIGLSGMFTFVSFLFSRSCMCYIKSEPGYYLKSEPL